MRRPLPLRHLVAAVGTATIAVVIWGTTMRSPDGGSAPVDTGATRSAPTAAVAAMPSGRVTSPPETAPQPAVRTVSGPGIAPLPPAATPPVRIEPPKPPPPPTSPVMMRRLMPVTMEDTADLSAGAIRIRLPGVGVIGPEETCRDGAGAVWPCGRRALAGVRAIVRGRAVDCPLPEKVKRGDFVADCRLGGADLAERIVASGWARALDREGRLAEAERGAEAKALGLHAGAAPNTVDPLPAPGELPPDTTTAPIGTVAPQGSTNAGGPAALPLRLAPPPDGAD